MSVEQKNTSGGARIKFYGLAVAVAAAIFTLGVFTGNGTIHLTSPGQQASQTGLPKTLDFSSVNEVYTALRQNYNGKLTEQQVLDGLKHGLASSTGDPYTQFFTAKESQGFNEQLQGTFSGIGAQLDQDTEGNIVVVAPIAGSPAEAAGVRAQDIIADIDGTSTSGMTAQGAVTKIRGPKGTQVTLTLVRNKSQTLKLTITRDDITVPSVTSKILDGNIGYLQVSQFSDNTFTLAQEAVASFEKAGVTKIVLDLRDNPGGLVDSAVNVSSLWLPKGATIMQEKRGNTVVDTLRATGKNPLQGKQTVVLLNGGSASASEITAAALRDNKAATIIGEKSYGKGVEQQIIPFSDGSQLKVTVADWNRPNGQNINKKGITPDQTVKMTEDDYKNKTDPQLDAATAYLNK